jgi:DNA-binding CsgD family transcriptional regulator
MPYVLVFLGLAELLDGEVENAAAAAEEGLAAAIQANQETQEAFLLSLVSLINSQRGKVDETYSEAARSLELADRTGAMIATIWASWGLGLLELSRGRPAETLRVLSPLRERLDEAGAIDPGALRFLGDEIEALVAVGRLDEAKARLDLVEDHARSLGRASALAALARGRGLLAAARGETEAALDTLDQALAKHEQISIPFERGRTLTALGAVRRRAKRKREAREALAEAVAVFEQLNAPLWAEKAHAELGRIGGRASSGHKLTPTEERVAALVAEGKTNREAAAALVVSERTVEFHLSHVYRKLGVRSRTELAHRYAEHS